MVHFKRIVARDTFAYQLLDFNFEKGIHTVKGSNGSSKTSIFLALMQGLFNKNAKGMKIDEVNNRITGQPYEIEIWFEKAGKQYWVKNSKKAGKIEITENGKEIHLKRIPDNLKLIEEKLGCDYALFCDLIYQSPESSINLLETNSDGERKKFINRINRLDELDFHLDRMKGREKELAGKNGVLSSLQNQIQGLEGGLTELQEELEEVDVKLLEEQVKEHSDLVVKTKSELAVLDKEQQDLQSLLKAAEENQTTVKQLASLEQQLAKVAIPEGTLEDYQSQAANLQTKAVALAAQKQEAESRLKRAQYAETLRSKASFLTDQATQIEIPENPSKFIEDQIGKITNLKVANSTRNRGKEEERRHLQAANSKGTCPTCHQGVESGYFDAEIEKLNKEIEEANALIAKCEASLTKYEGQRQSWKKLHEINQSLETLKVHPDFNMDREAIQAEVDTLLLEQDRIDSETARVTEAVQAFLLRQRLESSINSLRSRMGTVVDLDSTIKQRDEVGITITVRTAYLQEVEEVLRETGHKLDKAKEHNALAKARRELNETIRENNSRILIQLSELQKEKQTTEETLECIKTWVGILGSKGYRVHKIKRFLRNLNLTMDKYSDMISNNRIRCEFFIDEDGEIDFTVTDANKSISFSGWSNGEKARVKLACLFAVLEMLESMGTASFNVLALDEIFGSLDDDGKEGLFTVLSNLQGKGKSIYTIAHSELVLPLTYDSEIHAEKLEDGTTQVTQ